MSVIKTCAVCKMVLSKKKRKLCGKKECLIDFRKSYKKNGVDALSNYYLRSLLIEKGRLKSEIKNSDLLELKEKILNDRDIKKSISYENKKCSCCKIIISKSFFSLNSKNKDGLNRICKDCTKKQYQKNKERVIELARKRRELFPSVNKDYYQKNKDRERLRVKIYSENNKEKIKERGKRNWQKNREKNLEKGRQIRKTEAYKVKSRAYKRKRYRNDVAYNIDAKMSRSIKRALSCSKNGFSWEKIVGYTQEQLRVRLKNTMPIGYNWEDFLKGKLHIDHIIPRSAFNYSSFESCAFKKCWHLLNLQLLPSKENLKKSNKILKPFQAVLDI